MYPHCSPPPPPRVNTQKDFAHAPSTVTQAKTSDTEHQLSSTTTQHARNPNANAQCLRDCRITLPPQLCAGNTVEICTKIRPCIHQKHPRPKNHEPARPRGRWERDEPVQKFSATSPAPCAGRVLTTSKYC